MHSSRVAIRTGNFLRAAAVGAKPRRVEFPKTLLARPLSSTSDVAKTAENKERKEEDSVSWRENSALKYWVIAGLGVSGLIYYYVYSNYEKKRLVLKSFPPKPDHFLHPRESDIANLTAMHNELSKKGSGLAVLHVVGYPGSGKTQLVRAFAEKLARQEEERHRFLPGNLLFGAINASSLSSLLFDVRRLAVSAGCVESDWTSKCVDGKQFFELSSEEQLDCFVAAVKEKLKASQGWVLLLENVKDKEILNRWFLDDWQYGSGKGTILVTSRSCVKEDSLPCSVYNINKGMEVDDGVDLLGNLSGLPDDKMMGAKGIVTQLKASPLVITCAGHYIKCKATEDPYYSAATFLNELDTEMQQLKQSNCNSGVEPMHAVIAMETRNLVQKNPHLLHTFDLLGTCASDWPVPITLIALHLRSSDFGLPPVAGSRPVLLSQQPTESVKEEKPEEEVQEMFLSVKKLAKNLETFMTAVKENVDAIKMMINPQLPELPAVADGVVDMLKMCPLVSVVRIDPVGVDAVVVSPLVHTVLHQLFLANTMYQLESDFLVQSEKKHIASSWFRQLWSFDPQRTLQEYRNSLGEVSTKEGMDMSHQSDQKQNILPVFSGPSVQEVLKNHEFDTKKEFRKIKIVDAVRHCQHHTARVLKSVNGVASVCGQDNQTRTLARLLKAHLDHILATGTSKSLGPKSRAHAISAKAAVDASLGSLESSRELLEQALGLELELFGDSSLEVASTMTRLADVYSSLDDAARSRELLERALRIYESQRKKSGEYKQPLDYARTLSALGATYGSQGFKERSRDYIERAFSVMQSSPPINPDEVETRRFTSDVASTLTDLGHAYLSLGEAMQARRLLDMAVNGLKNIHGEEHPEVVRALTVLGIAYTMQGNWPEARKMRKEAGKLQARLDAKPLI